MDRTTEDLLVKSTAPTGYRRGGRAWAHGENRVPAGQLSAVQLAQIEADPFLAVVAVQLAAVLQDADPATDPAPEDGAVDPDLDNAGVTAKRKPKAKE